jgi:regulator of sigma E protease
VPAEDAHRAFRSQPPIKRIAVMAAGPAANFLLAILLYWGLFLVSSPGPKPAIGEVIPGSIAAMAGLHPGDVVLAVGDRETPTREAVVMATLKDLLSNGRVDFRVADRNSSPREIRLDASGQSRALTEQGPLGTLGFEFWYPSMTSVLGTVEPASPAAKAGLKTGDEIVTFDGQPVKDFLVLTKTIEARAHRSVPVQVRRNGEMLNLQVDVGTKLDKKGHEVGRLGVGSASFPADMLLPRDSVFGALQRGIGATWEKTLFVFQSVGYMISGKVSLQSVSGPIGIAAVAGEAARIGLQPFINLLALISISIGALNLLPIPVLDGGQIVFQLAELLKGRPVSERAQMLGQQVGIALLILLTVLAFFNDITRLT